MLDIHSHILPKMDDGSKSVEETLQMLTAMSKQNITRVVATPHYLPSHESVDEFLARREKAFEVLRCNEVPEFPQIHLGAEVSYYEGISKLNNLSSLKITDSNLLLIEMPVGKWSEYAFHEIMNLACLPQTKIVLAHVERYRHFQKEEVWQQLLHNDILMQANARYFCDFATKRKALKQLQNNQIHFLGSDCHNLTTRPPCMGTVYDYIERKLGSDFLQSLLLFGHSFFNNR